MQRPMLILSHKTFGKNAIGIFILVVRVPTVYREIFSYFCDFLTGFESFALALRSLLMAYLCISRLLIFWLARVMCECFYNNVCFTMRFGGDSHVFLCTALVGRLRTSCLYSLGDERHLDVIGPWQLGFISHLRNQPAGDQFGAELQELPEWALDWSASYQSGYQSLCASSANAIVCSRLAPLACGSDQQLAPVGPATVCCSLYLLGCKACLAWLAEFHGPPGLTTCSGHLLLACASAVLAKQLRTSSLCLSDQQLVLTHFSTWCATAVTRHTNCQSGY